MIASPRLSEIDKLSQKKWEKEADLAKDHVAANQPQIGTHWSTYVWLVCLIIITLSVVVPRHVFMSWLSISDSSEPPERVDGTQSQQPAGTRTTDLDRGTQDLESLVLEQLPFGSIVKKTADRVRCHECRKKLPQRTMAEATEVFDQSILDLLSHDLYANDGTSGKATDPYPNLCAKCTQEATRLQLLVKSCSHTQVISKNIVNGQPYQLYPAADCWLLINYAIDVLFATDYAQHNEVGNNEALVKVRVILESFLLNREMSHHTKSLLMLLDTLSEPDENCQPLNAKSGVPEFEAQSSEF